MKVYVAGSSGEMARAEAQMAALRAAGIDVVSDWPEVIRDSGGVANPMDIPREARASYAGTDLSQVSHADVLWLLLPESKPTIGAWVEFGYALFLGAAAREARDAGIDAPNYWILTSGKETSIFTALAHHFETDDLALTSLLGRFHMLSVSKRFETTKAAPKGG